MEDLFGGAYFQELAGAHHGDARGDLGDHRQTVGDEYIGEREFALELLQEEKNLRTDGDIEGGDGFVGDDELGLENQGARDADALALAAGEFVRIAAHGVFVQADAAQDCRSALEALCRGEAGFVNGKRLGNDFADAHSRIERSEGILKNHLHLAALRTQLLPLNVSRSRPSKRSSPPSGSINRRSMRANVVFPQPLSPTIAKVSPLETENLTPSTAAKAVPPDALENTAATRR